MQIHHYDSKTKEYTHSANAKISPLEDGVYLIPADSVTIAPQACGEGFVNVWNEFIVAYLLVSENKAKPALFGLYDFLSQNIINLQVIAAACLIIASPMVILFLFTRRTFFKAMVEGAVKG